MKRHHFFIAAAIALALFAPNQGHGITPHTGKAAIIFLDRPNDGTIPQPRVYFRDGWKEKEVFGVVVLQVICEWPLNEWDYSPGSRHYTPTGAEGNIIYIIRRRAYPQIYQQSVTWKEWRGWYSPQIYIVDSATGVASFKGTVQATFVARRQNADGSWTVLESRDLTEAYTIHDVVIGQGVDE